MTVSLRPRIARYGVVTVGLLVVGAAVGWAGSEVLSPQGHAAPDRKYTYIRTTTETLGSSLKLSVRARWSARPAALNRALGTVTTVDAKNGSEVTAGSRVYSVDLRPVVVGRGTIPAYRDIAPGDEGVDVKQLQSLLADRGFYGGLLDGKAGVATVAAVKDWQRSMSIDPSGTVALGDVIFLPKLPARISLDPASIAVGAVLAGGEPAVDLLPAAPVFEIPVNSDQAAQISSGMKVEIAAKKKTWSATVTGQSTDQASGDILIRLGASGNKEICQSSCDTIPVGTDTLLPADVVTSEAATGVAVPDAALATKADGDLVVIDRAGRPHRVDVVKSSSGMSLVSGITAGLEVRIPAE
jgi:peptidoglycan hydrolase-like protein with peptidoglycan-binding domain